MGKKFVGLDGLKHFWTKAKTWIAGQITAEVTAKIAEIVANAPEDLDTLKEIADWIKNHANDASAMNTQINTNKSDISALKTSVAGKADTGHTHDDRYFTETEVTNKLAGKSDTGHTHTKSQITDFAHTHDDRYFTETEVTKKLEDYQAKEWKVLDGNDISGIDFDEVAVSIYFLYDNIEVLYSQQYSKGMLGSTQILMVGGYFFSYTDYGLCNLNFTNGLFSKRNVIFAGKDYKSVSGLKIRYR